MGDQAVRKVQVNMNLREKQYFIDTACLIIHLVWMILFFAEGIIFLGVLNLVSCVTYLYLYTIIENDSIAKSIIICSSEVLFHTISALLCIGLHGCFDLYIIVFIPVTFFFSFIYSEKKKLLCAGGIVAGIIYIILRTVMIYFHPIYEFTNRRLEACITVFNTIMCLFVLLTVTFLLCREVNQTRKELERNNQKLMFLSSHDPLTHLLNRRRLEEVMMEIKSKDSNHGLYAAAFFDIDDFKLFNDRHGHKCGDSVLVKVSEIICESTGFEKGIEAGDTFVCRWGGEEIVVLFRGYTRNKVVEMIEKAKDQIALYRNVYEGTEISVSVTCGIAFGEDPNTLQKLIDDADTYMIKGKNSGKNCIIIEGT